MPDLSFSGLLIVTVVAFLAPLVLSLTPARRLPTSALEIVAGIVLGPSVLGWVKVDLPLAILSVFGLAFLLFLSGLEVDLERLRGRLLVFVGSWFLLSSIVHLSAHGEQSWQGSCRQPRLRSLSQIGTELGLITRATSAALIAAGLLSVLIFPLLALTILRRAEPAPIPMQEKI